MARLPPTHTPNTRTSAPRRQRHHSHSRLIAYSLAPPRKCARTITSASPLGSPGDGKCGGGGGGPGAVAFCTQSGASYALLQQLPLVHTRGLPPQVIDPTPGTAAQSPVVVHGRVRHGGTQCFPAGPATYTANICRVRVLVEKHKIRDR